jgi:ribonuclease BN (tRNA processing enzyme)
MNFRVLGCYGGNMPGKFTTSFLLNEKIALDAGAISLTLSFPEQLKIRYVLLTHTHIDHTFSLPFFIDNIFATAKDKGRNITIFSHHAAISALKNHLFNDSSWPDFTIIPTERNPLLTFTEIEERKIFKIDEFTIKPIYVNHIIPTMGFFIKKSGKTAIFVGDTKATEEIWEEANKLDKLEAIFIETSFPKRFRELAEKSGHLTTKGLAAELAKLRHHPKIIIYHQKPQYIKEIEKELTALGIPGLELARQGAVYSF